jgi:hypothetical protein
VGAGRGGGRAVCGEENRAGGSARWGGARLRACGEAPTDSARSLESCAAEIDPIRLWTISDPFRGVRGDAFATASAESESGGASGSAFARRRRWE